jgi:YHS domain-containing protein/thiol-disulfide isomerase/thioredoxin
MEVKNQHRIARLISGLLAAFFCLELPTMDSCLAKQGFGETVQHESGAFQPSAIKEGTAFAAAGGSPTNQGQNTFSGQVSQASSSFPAKAGMAGRTQNQSPFPGGSTPVIAWMDGNELNLALRLAAQQNKPVMVHFWNERCAPCLALEKSVFPDPRLAEFINTNFVPVKVNTLQNPQIHQQLGVSQWPWDVFLTPDGSRLIDRASPGNVQQYLQHLASTANLQRNFNRFSKMVGVDQTQKPSSATGETKGQTGASSGLPDSQSRQATYSRSVVPPLAASGSGSDSKKSFSPEPTGINSGAFEARQTSNANQSNPQPWSVSQAGSEVKQEESPIKTSQQLSARSTQIRNQFFPVSSQGAANLSLSESSAEVDLQTGLEGKCPVSLLKDEKWVSGSKDWGCVHRGKLYLFKDQVYRDLFLQDPDRYAPVLAGYDVVEFGESGRLIDGKNSIGAYKGLKDNRRIYRFANEENKSKFKANPERYKAVIRTAMQVAEGRMLR